MKTDRLKSLLGTRWRGRGELWLDPLGNEAHQYDCTLEVGDGRVDYTWQHDGKMHKGALELGAPGGPVTWSDAWHQSKPVTCTPIPDAWPLLAVRYAYPAGEGPDWGWVILLAERPSGELVLQMTNITPWGEEGRAVRMVFEKDE